MAFRSQSDSLLNSESFLVSSGGPTIRGKGSHADDRIHIA